MERKHRLLTGQPQIDHDHKILEALIDKLADALKDPNNKAAIGGVLDELLNYTRTHFSMEEQLMATYGYKDAAAHHTLHGKFIHDVAAFKEKFDAGLSVDSAALLLTLREWLSQHIQKTDTAFVTIVPYA